MYGFFYQLLHHDRWQKFNKSNFCKVSHNICRFDAIGNFSLFMAQSFYQEFAERVSFKLYSVLENNEYIKIT